VARRDGGVAAIQNLHAALHEFVCGPAATVFLKPLRGPNLTMLARKSLIDAATFPEQTNSISSFMPGLKH